MSNIPNHKILQTLFQRTRSVEYQRLKTYCFRLQGKFTEDNWHMLGMKK